MKIASRTPTTMPIVVFVLEVVSLFRSSVHAVKRDKLEGAVTARAEGGGVTAGGREGSGIYIQCLLLRIYSYAQATC